MARVARSPVIAVMGHVDHGKSSLLDYIRKANVAAGEAGGITQHVAAYIAEHGGRRITFLDTPGHAAFMALRERGARAADIAILVVAADEGVMPQTLEALEAIQSASIPYVVAITKIDKNNADVERAKSSMLEHGIYLEGFGGDVPYAPISSKTGEGVPELLDLVLLAADLTELAGDPDVSATGYVLEASQDQKRGASATLVIKDGTLRAGAFVIAGEAYAPVRFIEDFRGGRIERAGPSEPVRVTGFNALPTVGAIFAVAGSKKEAEQLAKQAATERPSPAPAPEGVALVPLVVKADVAGSLDAIRHELAKVGHPHAMLRIVMEGVGAVAENDVKTAHAAGAAVIAFNVGTEPLARDLALRDGVAIESFTVIYELTERVGALLAERAPRVEVEEELGRAKVVATFSRSSRAQTIGATLTSGAFAVGRRVKLLRGGEELGRGAITNLQQQRANVKEVRTEGGFGIEIEVKEDARPGDELVCVTAKTV